MRTRRTALAAVSLLVVGCSPAATRSPIGTPDAPVRATSAQLLGVMPFSVAQSDTLLEPLSFGIAELLSTDLSRSARLTLVERARLGEVLRELSLSDAVRVDSSSAPRVGQLLQAHQLVLGALRFAPNRDLVFAARISDATTGRIDTALVASAPLSDVLAAEKAVAFRLFDQLGVNLTPAERARVEQVPTRNLGALVAYGQGVRAEVNGQYAAAYRAYRKAAKLDPKFANAKDRAQELRSALTFQTVATTAVDRVNRPIESVPLVPTPGLSTDPAFPSSVATVIITITRPRIQ